MNEAQVDRVIETIVNHIVQCPQVIFDQLCMPVCMKNEDSPPRLHGFIVSLWLLPLGGG